MQRGTKQFVKFVRQHLAEYGMKLVIGRGRKVNSDGCRCSGYFDEDQKHIKIGRKTPDFLSILVHEYCHFLQYINNSRVYQKSEKASRIVDNWFAGKNYSPLILKRAFFIVRSMELDCEKRAVRLIRKFGLPINLKIYSKEANCYVYSHFLMEKTRKFNPFKVNPYYSKQVRRIMPSKIDPTSNLTIPWRIYSVLESFTG